MAFLQASGLQTYYEQVGKGPSLILLHGWANTWEAWLPIIPLLSDHFTLLIPDLPSCGKTETPKSGWSTKDHARWLEAFITNSKFQIPNSKFFIAGHSFGGKILLEYCAGNYQPQSQKLILIDASGIPNILNYKQKIVQELAFFIPDFFKNKLPTAIKSKIYNAVDSDYAYANDFQKQTLRIILKEDYTSKLAAIAQPTLLLWGKDDSATPLWQAESMHGLIPLNQLHTFAAGHFPHHQFPKKVSEDICRFL